MDLYREDAWKTRLTPCADKQAGKDEKIKKKQVRSTP